MSAMDHALAFLCADELKSAILAVLRAYIASFNSSNTSSLNLLMQQQQQQQCQSEANWAGSIAGGAAKSSKSIKPSGYAGTIVSFSGSTAGSAFKQTTASAPTTAETNISSRRPASIEPSSSSVHRGGGAGPSVSFAGGPPGAGDEETGHGADAGAAGSSVAGTGSGTLLSKAGRTAGYAASVAAGSTARGGAAGSVAGNAVSGGVGGRPCSAGPTSDSLSLHGALVLCKEVGWHIHHQGCVC